MNRILIILPHNPGDVVMGLWVVSRLKETYPQAAIDFVVSDECASLVVRHPQLNRIWILPTRELRSHWEQGDDRKLDEQAVHFVEGIERVRYDLSVNLFQDPFGAVLHGLVKAARKTGYVYEEGTHYALKNRYLQHLCATPVNRSQNPRHVIDLWMRALDLSSEQRPIALLPPLPEPPVDPPVRPYVVLQMGSAWPGKQWPVGHWVKLARLLSPHYHIVFTGAAPDLRLWDAFLQDWGKGSPPGENTMGSTSLLDTAAIIKNARWLITGDTVAMHLAAALDTPCVALFGASNPVETGPYGDRQFVWQASPDVPETLPLTGENSGLASLDPEVLFAFLREGLTPPGYFWKTVWNASGGCWELRDARDQLHPFQKQSARWEAVMREAAQPDAEENNLPESIAPVKSSVPAGNLSAVGTKEAAPVIWNLDQYLANPSENNIHVLESSEHALAEATRHEVIWEAYRIGINSLSLRDRTQYLKERKKRLQQALREFNASVSAR